MPGHIFGSGPGRPGQTPPGQGGQSGPGRAEREGLRRRGRRSSVDVDGGKRERRPGPETASRRLLTVDRRAEKRRDISRLQSELRAGLK